VGSAREDKTKSQALWEALIQMPAARHRVQTIRRYCNRPFPCQSPSQLLPRDWFIFAVTARSRLDEHRDDGGFSSLLRGYR
jgi:hypothetical protein